MPQSFDFQEYESLGDATFDGVEYGKKPQIIEGVVSQRAQSAGILGEHEYMLHGFELVAWMPIDGEVVVEKLYVQRPIPKEHDYPLDFPEMSYQRMSVILSQDQERAVYEKSLPLEGTNLELTAAAQELCQSVIVESDRFGELFLDASIGWFEGEGEWVGQEIDLRFDTENPEELKEMLKTAELLWTDQEEWNTRIRQQAIEDLHQLYNGTWREEKDPELTPNEFADHFSLSSVTIDKDGQFEFWHHDGGLFLEHSIQVYGSVHGGSLRATLAG
ncbi:MAG: DUF2262 domain-containing protein [Lacipirellulaceae bacterium]